MLPREMPWRNYHLQMFGLALQRTQNLAGTHPLSRKLCLSPCVPLARRRARSHATTDTWVHSSVVRAADCRSAGPWFKSGCSLLVLCCEWFGSQSPKHDTNASYTRRHLHIGGTHWKSLMGSAVVCNHCYHGKLSCISGLVVEYIVAIDVTRVRFPADAFRRLSFKALLNGVH